MPYLKDKKDGYSESDSIGFPVLFGTTQMISKDKNELQYTVGLDALAGLFFTEVDTKYYDKEGNKTKKSDLQADLIYGLLISVVNTVESNSDEWTSGSILYGILFSGNSSKMKDKGIKSIYGDALLGLLFKVDEQETPDRWVSKASILTPIIFSRMAVENKKSKKSFQSVNFLANCFGWTTADDKTHVKLFWMQF